MNQPPQTGKRIVSKGAYARAQVTRTWRLSVAAALFGCSAAGGAYTLWTFGHDSEPSTVLQYLLSLARTCFAYLLLYLAKLVWCFARSVWEDTCAMEPVVPLTRANIGHLPAPASLVRASAEPVQEQQSVLLRAATEGMERHEEQLVRASAGGTEQQ